MMTQLNWLWLFLPSYRDFELLSTINKQGVLKKLNLD